MFSIMAHNRRQGWQNLEKKSYVRQLIFEILSPSEPIIRAIIEKMVSPDYVLRYLPQVLEMVGYKI